MFQEIMKQRIADAQKHIDATKNAVKQGAMRQRYHFMAESGWINDPNGLIFFRGKYHFFYQYNPYHGFWDCMYWGHAVSEDMIHWEYLPLALAPSEPYDDHQKGGCFSGSAIEHDGKLFLMYTGTTNNGNGFEQAQCVAYSVDGIHFEKYEGNPVVTAPEGVPTDFFRDPKVWKHEDTYYMVCGASRNKMGQALIYRSSDMLHWTYLNVLAESRGEWGYMWECPDFYPLGDQFVLMFSPMGAGERTCVYLVGDFDYDTGKFVYTTSGEIDWGFDYYAPQSFQTPDGRRILAGWSNAWDWMPWWKDWGPTYREGWCGCFNIPREAVLCPDHTLKFVPAKELEALRGRQNVLENISVGNDHLAIPAGDGVAFELRLEIDLDKTTAKEFCLELRSDGEKATCITYDLKHQTMGVDRSHADDWSTGVTKSPLLLRDRHRMQIHIFADQSSIEAFTDAYQTNHSCNIFAKSSQNQNFITAKDGALWIEKLEVWELGKVCG